MSDPNLRATNPRETHGGFGGGVSERQLTRYDPILINSLWCQFLLLWITLHNFLGWKLAIWQGTCNIFFLNALSSRSIVWPSLTTHSYGVCARMSTHFGGTHPPSLCARSARGIATSFLRPKCRFCMSIIRFRLTRLDIWSMWWMKILVLAFVR
jgi:hypothetical protein